MVLLKVNQTNEFLILKRITASRTNISNISSRLTESKSDNLTKLAPGSESTLPSTASLGLTNTSSSKNSPQKSTLTEKETEALVIMLDFRYAIFI